LSGGEATNERVRTFRRYPTISANAAGGTGRRSPAEWVRSRSRAFWIVVGLTALAALLRFATLGVQSYHHDEIVTASRVLRDGFGHAMDAVWFSESTPPVYYALAWVWAQLVGTGEFGLRTVSAVAGVATVPVAYLIGVELRGRRAGLWAAALVAVNPMMLWYSQEARAYALVALFGALSALYWLRAERGGARRDFVWWGIWSGLALGTHYFVAFPILAEAVMLLRRRGRTSLVGMAILAGCAIAVAPLAIHQMSIGHADWIGNFSLGHRLGETATTFLTGETGDIIARPERSWLAFVPLAPGAARAPRRRPPAAPLRRRDRDPGGAGAGRREQGLRPRPQPDPGSGAAAGGDRDRRRLACLPPPRRGDRRPPLRLLARLLHRRQYRRTVPAAELERGRRTHR
jgi:hypothetical protein